MYSDLSSQFCLLNVINLSGVLASVPQYSKLRSGKKSVKTKDFCLDSRDFSSVVKF